MSNQAPPSNRPRRLSSLLPALIVGPLLLCCVASSSASARTKSPANVTQVVEFELRVLGDADTSREFVVPIEGKLSGWTELFDGPRFCRLQSNSMNDERLNMRIRCFTHSRGQPAGDLEFELETTRALAVGEATVIGEIESREGRRIQVIATRR